ncbi:MAG: transketolase C-terminal domain-containing protein [Ruminococcus bromii]|nr:transketolase [Ruminococcus bromii]MDD6433276.1 transketolase C-terminal domain-containing protein [Ruminococcus bromii]MDY4711853.1 transketolase C-terminal domain-containing protein [Ruminococcus bromii]MEE3499562.1 transketolase C-terminal domain-containing protein [Ruminococcus bromii]HCB95256.1 transketolase [Ruminococcus sp.]
MRDTVIRTLIELGKSDKNVELITGDLGFGVLKPFWETLPDQFVNAGIAEQNMTGVAAGLALEGKKVFTYSIGNFPTLRCLEQIRNDCAYHNANVNVICVGGGYVYGSLGMSHHATEDIAILRALPDVTVICPGDPTEAALAVKKIANTDGTCYLRLGRGGEKNINNVIKEFEIGKAYKLRESKGADKSIAVFSTGAILEETTKACDMLEADGFGVEQYSFPTVKPIDKQAIIDCAKKFDNIFTVEEHNVVGGFGSAVAEVLAECGENTKLHRIGINDFYCIKVGSQAYLREQVGINAEGITNKVKDVFGE